MEGKVMAKAVLFKIDSHASESSILRKEAERMVADFKPRTFKVRGKQLVRIWIEGEHVMGEVEYVDRGVSALAKE